MSILFKEYLSIKRPCVVRVTQGLGMKGATSDEAFNTFNCSFAVN